MPQLLQLHPARCTLAPRSGYLVVLREHTHAAACPCMSFPCNCPRRTINGATLLQLRGSPHVVPATFKKLSKLNFFWLTSCAAAGPLPPLARLPAGVKSIDLRFNSFTGGYIYPISSVGVHCAGRCAGGCAA